MISSRRIVNAVVSENGHPLSQPSPQQRLARDPELAALIERATAEAASQAYEQGRREAQAEAGAHIDRLAQSVALAIDELDERIDARRQAAIGGVVDLARSIAEQVIGRTPHDGGAALLERITEALLVMDERPLTVTVHPDDAELVRSALPEGAGVEVGPDPALGLGEARISGGWSYADLTRQAAWAAIDRALEES